MVALCHYRMLKSSAQRAGLVVSASQNKRLDAGLLFHAAVPG